jgi:hypothetical protein
MGAVAGPWPGGVGVWDMGHGCTGCAIFLSRNMLPLLSRSGTGMAFADSELFIVLLYAGREVLHFFLDEGLTIRTVFSSPVLTVGAATAA